MLFAQFTRFAQVGAVATGIQYLLLFILVRWVGADPVLSSSVGFIVSALGNYFLNYHYTFNSNQQHDRALVKFGVLAGIGLIFNSIVMKALIIVGLHYLVAQICATVGVLVWNFAGNAFWTFRLERTRG